MKTLLFIVLLTVFVFTGQALAQTRKDVAFERYDTSYFIKRDALEDGSFLVVTNQEDFDKIFGAAARMGNNKFLPKGFFDSNIILVTNKTGNFLRKYEVKKIVEAKGKLYVSYNTIDGKAGSASFNAFMSVGVPKGDYTEVVFMENGKKVAALPVEDENASETSN